MEIRNLWFTAVVDEQLYSKITQWSVVIYLKLIFCK